MRAEHDFRAEVERVGMRVHGVQRLSLQGEQVSDMAGVMDNTMRTAFEDIYEKEPHWVNADGTASPAFKSEYLMQSLEMS